MEFFDKKEDVIDLKLTRYGRHLLSKGEFNPAFYSFFDDNVLYNSTKSGFTEEQNDAEARIKQAQTMQPQISFSSLDRQFHNNYNLILSGQEKEGSEPLQNTPERNHSLSMPLGTSDINSEYAPAWSVLFLKGQLSSNAAQADLTEKTGGKNTLKIPQLESTVVVEYENIGAADIEYEEFEDAGSATNISITSDEEEMIVLLKIEENNGFYQKKNFDIEMFEIYEEIQGANTIESLRPLRFSRNPDPETQVGFLEEHTPEDSPTFVDYYFDILFDDEIDDGLLCKYDPTEEKFTVFSDPRTEFCQDVLNKAKKKCYNIYDDNADPEPGDIC